MQPGLAERGRVLAQVEQELRIAGPDLGRDRANPSSSRPARAAEARPARTPAATCKSALISVGAKRATWALSSASLGAAASERRSKGAVMEGGSYTKRMALTSAKSRRHWRDSGFGVSPARCRHTCCRRVLMPQNPGALKRQKELARLEWQREKAAKKERRKKEDPEGLPERGRGSRHRGYRARPAAAAGVAPSASWGPWRHRPVEATSNRARARRPDRRTGAVLWLILADQPRADALAQLLARWRPLDRRPATVVVARRGPAGLGQAFPGWLGLGSGLAAGFRPSLGPDDRSRGGSGRLALARGALGRARPREAKHAAGLGGLVILDQRPRAGRPVPQGRKC